MFHNADIIELTKEIANAARDLKEKYLREHPEVNPEIITFNIDMMPGNSVRISLAPRPTELGGND